MSSTASSRTSSRFRALRLARHGAVLFALLAGCAGDPPGQALPPDPLRDLRHWRIEAERPDTRVSLRHGVLDIDSPAGVTVWLDRELDSPLRIEFDATAVSAGGRNDQVSDLNVFWMAREAGGAPLDVGRRSGRFADYDDLETYYVGLGGNRNTTTRFRRYVGRRGERPLLPAHDLSGPDVLLVPNARQHITLIADGSRIEYQRDGRVLFALDDAAPYTRGRFALRTTWNHLRVENLRLRRP